MMEIPKELLRQIISDLGLDVPYSKGQKIKVRNCWHFSTDGNAVDVMFYDTQDFIDGMNRIYVTLPGYRVIILAYSLMDTHVHFILYGEFDECNRFMHDYVRRTSCHIAFRHGDKHKMDGVPINYQAIDTDFYLKVVICYTIKNAPAGGIPYNAIDYPWSSGPLYFRRAGDWSSPVWLNAAPDGMPKSKEMGVRQQKRVLKSHARPEKTVRMTGPIVFPGTYVAYEIVEKIYKTCKSFNYFLCISKEEDVDARGGTISHLSIPMQEMRQHKKEVCKEMFGTTDIKKLDTQHRIRLARVLRTRFNSSKKQIIRLCGLVYEEAKDMI
ncbi:MAG: hypothetical protein IJJ72_03400 [Bacteroidales bacterium]|nr:hypothetical protein [Bacteroidales bacterium]